MNARNITCNLSMDDQVRQIHEAWRNAVEPYDPTPEDEAAYTSWAAKNEEARQIQFNEWLNSSEGDEWMNSQAERHTLEYGVGSAAAGCGYH